MNVYKKNIKRILVVEDNILWQKVLRCMLDRFGYTIKIVSNAQDAIKYLKRNHQNVCLVISDVNMPGMSGLDLISFMKSSSILNQIPVILQSGEGRHILESGIDMGALNYVQKPYDSNDLLKALNTVIHLENSTVIKKYA